MPNHSPSSQAQSTGRLGYSIRGLGRLFGVNRSWYYERQGIAARRKKAENELKAVVEKLVVKFAGYGVRWVTHALKKMGYHLGERKVRRLLKEWGLGWQPLRKRKPLTTQPDKNAVRAENKLGPAKAQDEITQPDRAWVGNVVYVATKSESGFLATLLDGYTRRVVGWAISRFNDTALTLKALEQAISARHPGAGLIHHTDYGSNYTSSEYRGRLDQIGAVVSHSRPGRPQENGMAESFNDRAS